MGMTLLAAIPWLNSNARPFTVEDDVALRVIHDSCTDNRDRVVYSPNGEYFFIYSTRGRLSTGQVEDEIRIYSVRDVARFLNLADAETQLSPLWALARSSLVGPVINNCRWMSNSQGIAFLERSSTGSRVLMAAELSERRVRQLTPSWQSVDGFDIRDAQHFVYRVPDLNGLAGRVPEDTDSVTIVGTGQSLPALVVPEDVASAKIGADVVGERAHLWVAAGGEPSEVTKDTVPVTVSAEVGIGLALSPDGKQVATVVPLQEVPKEWEVEYPPPTPGAVHRLRAGAQNSDNFFDAHRYARIDLASGAVTMLAAGPTGFDAGWRAGNVAAWSRDGNRIALTASYTGETSGEVEKPCVSVVDLKSGRGTCLWMLKQPGKEDYGVPWTVEFVGGDPRLVRATLFQGQEAVNWLEFEQENSGRWSSRLPPRKTFNSVHIWVEEDLNRPPLVMASRDGRTRVLWDPNPELRGVELGNVSVYHWQDAAGRRWTGGLYAPVSYRTGERYPLVIQTHGFRANEFNPGGIYATANAAQELAGAGFFVLQVQDITMCDAADNEAKCATAGYDGAVKQLSAEGKIDEQRVGLEGFSWTCFYVTDALAFGTTQYRAATITDGVQLSYLEYLTTLDNGGVWPQSSDQILGPPFGANLARWIHESPIFNLDRSQAAIQVIALGKESLLYMWEPYARLRYAHGPVDLVLLNTSEHVVTNPKVRVASQGGTVDWFRFWLKGDEDADAPKAYQHQRWKELCGRQVAMASHKTPPCAREAAVDP